MVEESPVRNSKDKTRSLLWHVEMTDIEKLGSKFLTHKTHITIDDFDRLLISIVAKSRKVI